MRGAVLGRRTPPRDLAEVRTQEHSQGLSGEKHRILNKDSDEQLKRNTETNVPAPDRPRLTVHWPLPTAGHRAGGESDT